MLNYIGYCVRVSYIAVWFVLVSTCTSARANLYNNYYWCYTQSVIILYLSEDEGWSRDGARLTEVLTPFECSTVTCTESIILSTVSYVRASLLSLDHNSDTGAASTLIPSHIPRHIIISWRRKFNLISCSVFELSFHKSYCQFAYYAVCSSDIVKKKHTLPMYHEHKVKGNVAV